MTNEQMKENFGVTGYCTISISMKEGEDAGEAAQQIKELVSGVPDCVVRDYSSQIQAQNLYLNQQMMFFYGISAVLLGISLLHILTACSIWWQREDMSFLFCGLWESQIQDF